MDESDTSLCPALVINPHGYKLRLTLIRHGQTIENTQNRCQGHSVGTLSELGIAQAQGLALSMQGQRFDGVFCSDLSRARRTAEIIFPHAVIKEDQRLRERFYGDLEGKVLPSHLRFDDDIEGAETLNSLRIRLEDFLAMLCLEFSGKELAIVSHGIVIKTLLSLYTKQDFKDIRIPKNCTPFQIEV